MSSRSLSFESVIARRYWHRAEGMVVVSSFEESGQTELAFCHQHGIEPRRLQFWLSRAHQSEPPPASFAELVVRSESCSALVTTTVTDVGVPADTIVIRFGGVTAAVPSSAGPSFLAAVIRQVASC